MPYLPPGGSKALAPVFCSIATHAPKPTAWLFEAEPRMFPLPVFLPESQAASLDLDEIGLEYQASRLDRREFAAFHVYRNNLRSADKPLYNAHAGFEDQRGVLLSVLEDRPNLLEVGCVLRPASPDAHANRSRTYFIPESRILWAVCESWKHPREPRWATEVVYAVVPDSLLDRA
jgi:hypothetical protein